MIFIKNLKISYEKNLKKKNLIIKKVEKINENKVE